MKQFLSPGYLYLIFRSMRESSTTFKMDEMIPSSLDFIKPSNGVYRAWPTS